MEQIAFTTLVPEEGINISAVLSALAKEGRALKNEPETPEEPKSTKKRVTANVKIVLENYPDFILERDYQSKTVHFVYLVSANTAFFKTAYKSGKVEKELFTNTDQLFKFFGGASETIEFNDDFWAEKINGSKDAVNWYLDIMRDTRNCEIIKRLAGTSYRFGKVCYEFSNSSLPCRTHIGKIYVKEPKLFETVKKLDFTTNVAFEIIRDIAVDLENEPSFIRNLIAHFGLDNARDYIASMQNSPFVNNSFPSTHETQCFEQCGIFNGEYKRFKEYTLIDAIQMGYSYHQCSFWNEWKDTLRMQRDVYGKVVNKYPACLPMVHQQLSSMFQIRAEEIDANKLAVNADKYKFLEGRIGSTDLVVVVPTCKQDFLDEATAQSNCLASYVKYAANGTCIIIFVRKADDAEKSYITVELDPDNYSIRQFRMSFNREGTYYDREALVKHIERRLIAKNTKEVEANG